MNLAQFDLRDTNLNGADLRQIDFSELGRFSRFIEVNMAQADLRDANLFVIYTDGITLTEANLLGANLTGAKLQRAILTGATMPDGSIHE